MGALAELGDDDIADPVILRGEGSKLVQWWLDADEDDRALLRRWVDAGIAHNIIAERLTTSGTPIARHTVGAGVRTLRRNQWAP